MTTYNQMVKNLAVFLRDELKQLDDIHSLSFEITIEGRVHDGDINIEYKIGSTYSDGGCVKGGDLSRVVDEYKRRFGWDKRNNPICLSFNGEESAECAAPRSLSSFSPPSPPSGPSGEVNPSWPKEQRQ